MTYYIYKRGNWRVAVDAINIQDAAQWIKENAPGAKFDGVYRCGGKLSETITGAVTARRDAEIRLNYKKQMEEK
jgi:hypothetical protein